MSARGERVGRKGEGRRGVQVRGGGQRKGNGQRGVKYQWKEGRGRNRGDVWMGSGECRRERYEEEEEGEDEEQSWGSEIYWWRGLELKREQENRGEDEGREGGHGRKFGQKESRGAKEGSRFLWEEKKEGGNTYGWRREGKRQEERGCEGV